MIDEKKLIEELKEKGKEYDEDCGCWERKGEQGNRLICAGKCVGIVQAIEIVENQTKVGKWIPCSETMPPKPDENPLIDNKQLELYLVSVEGEDYVFRAFWTGKFFTDGWERFKPIAWQPLPEPYREGQEIKKQTNADRIRNMTDEELAYFLSDVKTDGIYYERGMVYPVIPDVWKYWLQSEVEE